MDTGGGADRRGRPDISCYVDAGAADLVTAADVVVESKKPSEIEGHADLKAALISADLWSAKFVRYVRAHAQQLSFFVLTSFQRFLAVPITADIRAAVARPAAVDDEDLQKAVAARAVEFDLLDPGQGARWVAWCEDYLSPAALRSPPLSTTLDLTLLEDTRDLERFAEALANVVVGREGRNTYGGALVSAIDLYAEHLDDLDESVRNSLVFHTLARHSGMTLDEVGAHLAEHLREELADFVTSSVQSLVGRLFAYKTIEDCFCRDVEPPLIERKLWIFHTDRYDQTPPEELAGAMFKAMATLAGAANPIVRGFAETGRFYDWLAPKVEPAAFRRLASLFFAHDLGRLDGDLLGRFFEIYAQRASRRRRRERGQYYTPAPIVAFMWRRVIEYARQAGVLEGLVALDPGMGSGTFLIEGARRLESAGLARFWDRLYGFDLDAQAVAVAQINLYLAVLGQLDRGQADEVGELHLYPTDALDPTNGERLKLYLPLFAPGLREFLRGRIALSERVKRAERFDVIVGNPPYLNNSTRTLAQVAGQFPRLLATSRRNARARQRNVRDDYAWFFAAADHYIRGTGMIAYVVSDSFCSAPSYRFFRQDLLRHYCLRSLVHLGPNVFQDVGPRISFVIVFLERRAQELAPDDPAQAFDYLDLRPLTLGNPPDILGTQDDPRLLVLAQASNASGDDVHLPTPVRHVPLASRDYTFVPSGSVVAQVEAAGPPVHERTKGEGRIFLKKWPGVITAFDVLLKANDPRALAARMRSFFETASDPERPRENADLGRFATGIGIRSDADRARLLAFAEVARSTGMVFETERIRRTVSGNAPDNAAWYPDAAQTCWLYYEPSLVAARNQYEGKDPGYGTMTQWRDAASHSITPKLVYTSSRNPARGLKAFVLHDEWLVKIHGGTRQQFNYTGLDDPNKGDRLDGLPNNLGADALEMFSALELRNGDRDAFLFYVAGLYNSQTTRDYVAQGGQDFLRVPVDPTRVSVSDASDLADAAKMMRNVTWLAVVLQGTGKIDTVLAESLLGEDGAERFGLLLQRAAGRFRGSQSFEAGSETWDIIEARRAELQEDIDQISRRLYNN